MVCISFWDRTKIFFKSIFLIPIIIFVFWLNITNLFLVGIIWGLEEISIVLEEMCSSLEKRFNI
jgi:hypothetical protein